MVSLELLFANSLSVSAYLPWSAWFATAREASPRFVQAIGDPSASIGYSARIGDGRLGASCYYRHPLGLWNPYAIEATGIASGTGHQSLGFSLAFSRFFDPAILGIRLVAETGLPRSDRWGSSMKPFIGQLSLNLTDALNDRISISIGVDQSLALPTRGLSAPDSAGYSYSCIGGASFALIGKSASIRVGVARAQQPRRSCDLYSRHPAHPSSHGVETMIDRRARFRFLSLVVAFCLSASCSSNQDSWYPQGSTTIASIWENMDTTSKSCTVTMKSTNTGTSKISASTVSLSVTTDAHTYYRTNVSGTTILPGGSVFVSLDIAHSNSTESLATDGVTIVGQFYE